MKTFLLLATLMGTCFAQDLTLEERISNLEKKIQNIDTYVEENCEIVYGYVTSSNMGCSNSVVTNIRTHVRREGGGIYPTSNYFDCKRLRLV